VFVVLLTVALPAWTDVAHGPALAAAQVFFRAAQVEQEGELPCVPVLCMTPVKFDVGWESGTVRFFVTNCECDVLEWTAASACSWAQVSPESGTLAALETATVVITYTYNDSCDTRSCDIGVVAPGAIGSPGGIRLNQGKRTTPDMCVAPTVRNVWANAGTVGFEIWNWSCVDVNWGTSKDVAWVTNITPASGTLRRDERVLVEASVSPNPSCDPRTGRIYFTAPGQTKEKYGTINQAGSTRSFLDVSTTLLSAPATFGVTTFQVSNTACGTVEWAAATTCSWVLGLSPESGTLGANESASVSVVHLANTVCSRRQCDIRVTAPEVDGSPRTIRLSQEEGGSPVLSVTPSTLNVGSASGWTSFAVKNSGCSNMVWAASHACGWLTSISPSSGQLGAKETATITVLYAANSGDASRTCPILIDAPGAGGPKTLNLVQASLASPVLSVAPLEHGVEADAGTFAFTVTNSGAGTLNWSAQQQCSWITSVSPSAGSLAAGQSTTVMASYGANANATSRACTVAVAASGAVGSPQTVSVTQAGQSGQPVLSVAPNARTVSDKAGSTSFTVTNTGSAPMSWGASTDCGWITGISPTSGTLAAGQSTLVSVAYAANPQSGSRNCSILVTAPDAADGAKTFTVAQAANSDPVLQVSGIASIVDAKAGVAMFTVANAGGGSMSWSANAACSWITSLAPTSGTLAAGQGITVVLNYASNLDGPPRSCNITVNAPGAVNSPQTIGLSQAGDETPALAVSSATLAAEADAGSATFNVMNAGNGPLNWSLAWECDWVSSVAPTGGALAAGANATVTVTFDENTGADERACVITVTAPGVDGSPQTVTLNQAGVETAPPPCCGLCPLFKDDWKSSLPKQLGDLFLLGASFMIVLALAKMRRP